MTSLISSYTDFSLRILVFSDRWLPAIFLVDENGTEGYLSPTSFGFFVLIIIPQVLPHSSISAPWDVRQPWPGSTFNVFHDTRALSTSLAHNVGVHRIMKLLLILAWILRSQVHDLGDIGPHYLSLFIGVVTKQVVYFKYIEVCLKNHWQYVSHNKDPNVERLHRADEVKSRLNRACFGVPGGLPCPPLNIKRRAETQKVKLGEQSGERYGNKALEEYFHGCRKKKDKEGNTIDSILTYIAIVFAGNKYSKTWLWCQLILTQEHHIILQSFRQIQREN